MKLWRTLLVLLFAVPVVWAQRSPRVVDSLAAMAALPRSSANPDVLVQGANGGSFKWVSNSTTATNVADVVASPYGAASGRYIRQPLMGGTVDLGSAGITFDGGTYDYNFTAQNMASVVVDGRSAQLTGLTNLTLDGQRDLSIFARTNLFFITPRVWALQAEVGSSLELMDASGDLGRADFKATRVSTISALKALPVTAYQDGAIIRTLGYHTGGDGYAGHYRYASSSVAAADDGLVIAPGHGVGRFHLMHSGSVSLGQFGAKGDSGTTDNSASFSAALAALNAGSIRKLVVPYGNFYVNGMHSLTGSNISIEGVDSFGSSTITGHRTTSGNTTLFRVYGTNTAFVNLGITRSTNTGGTASDAIAYMKFWRLENTVREFLMRGCYINGNASGQIARNGYYFVEIDAFGITSTAGTCPEGIRIQDNFWTDTTSRAIDLNGVRHAIVTGNRFYRCGINNYTGAGNTLNPGTCVEFASYDFESPPGTFNANPSYNIVVANNVFYEWGDGAVNYANVYDSSIIGNTIAGPYTDGVGTALSTINGIALFGGQNVTISGNEVSYMRNFGILVRPQNKASSSWLHNLRNVTISANVCRAGRAGSTNLPTSIQVYALETNVVTEGVVVIGNSYYGDHNSNTAIGIQCAASSSMRNVQVVGNTLYGGGSGGTGYGIEATLSGTVSGISINQNAIRGFSVGIFNGSDWPSGTQFNGNIITDCTTLVSNSGSLGVYSGDSFYAARGAASGRLAQSGAFRLPNLGVVNARNAANSADIELISSTATDRVNIAGGVLDVQNSSGAIRSSSTGKFTFSAPSASTLAAGATLTVTGTTHQISGSGGAVTLSTTTAISAGSNNGQILILAGMDNTNTVTIPDSGNCFLGAARTLGVGDSLFLQYRTASGSLNAGWYEISFTDN